MINIGIMQNSIIYKALAASLSNNYIVWLEITGELSTKCAFIGLAGYKSSIWMLLLNLVTWGAAMELWEALLSTRILEDIAENEICSYKSFWAKGTKTSEVGT